MTRGGTHRLTGAIARRVGAADREKLARRLRRPVLRRVVLGTVFRVMPRVVRHRALERERVAIEWRIGGRADGGNDVWQLVIEDGAATVLAGAPREADLTFTLEAVTLLLLVTGNASGPALYVRGDLQMKGDPWLAMRLPQIFATGRPA